MTPGQYARRGFAGEDLVAKLFQRLGYEVQTNVRVAGTEVDLIVRKDGSLFPVEVKGSAKLSLSELQRQAVRLRSLQDIDERLQSPIIVLLGKASPEATYWAQQQFNIQI